jgi:tetratricopeptide (TPR) repeat protein
MALNPNEKPDKSVSKFESMLKTDDVYFFDSEDFETIIHHYLNHGKLSLAKKAIQIGLQQHTHSMELKLLRVEVLVFEDAYQEAEGILDELQQLDPSNDEIYIQRANIHSKQDDHLGAVNLLLEALHMTDDALDIHSLLGMEYLFMDDYEKAKRSFIQCLEFDEKDYSALYNVVYCFEFLEDFQGAVHFLNDYLERNPYCEVAWHQLGKMYCTLELDEEALVAFDFAIISDDQFIGAYFEKGKVLERLKRYNEAIECYEMTMQIDDPTSHAYLRIGKCHEKLQNFDLAKYYYYNTVHEDPLLDKGWLAITDFYFRLEEYKRALHYVNKAINIDGENPVYWKKAALTYQALQDWDEADYAYRQSVELGNYELETYMGWVDVLLRNGEAEAAIDILKQGVEFHPESAELLYLLAGSELQRHQTRAAQEYFGKALQLDVHKIRVFETYFPEFLQLPWVIDIFSVHKKAST